MRSLREEYYAELTVMEYCAYHYGQLGWWHKLLTHSGIFGAGFALSFIAPIMSVVLLLSSELLLTMLRRQYQVMERRLQKVEHVIQDTQDTLAAIKEIHESVREQQQDNLSKAAALSHGVAEMQVQVGTIEVSIEGICAGKDDLARSQEMLSHQTIGLIQETQRLKEDLEDARVGLQGVASLARQGVFAPKGSSQDYEHLMARANDVSAWVMTQVTTSQVNM